MRADVEIMHWRATRERIGWLAVSLSMVLVPHIPRMPVWVSVSFVILALWRVANAIYTIGLPNRWYRVLLSLAITIGVLLSFGTLFGREAGIAALVVLAGMKLLETETLRDAFVVTFLGYFLVITNFLYSQTIATGVYMLLVVIVMTATLITISSPHERFAIKTNLRYAFVLLVQSIPLMLVLFLLFPRIPGPLWGLPKDARSATSSLSDSMSPGTISELSLSSRVAFRVKFEGPIPPPSKLYWRGPVFWKTDGRTWSSGKHQLNNQLPDIELRGEPLYYSITQEPHNQRWVIALDVPGSVQSNIRISEQYQLFSNRRLRYRTRFRLRSYPDALMKHMTLEQRVEALALAPRTHPRARKLALQWRSEVANDAQLVDKALSYFRTQPFFYTLNPPLLIGDVVDEFLFESRRGFCEFYAAAFTVLMRAAGIPTRIVTGYQGGDLNPLGDYVIVRQRDAHAWSEVWLEGRGWVRVDPTAAVSPERIEQGLETTLPNPLIPEVFQLSPGTKLASVLKNLRHGLDAINNSWNLWVLGYGPAQQGNLLEKMGLDSSNLRGMLFTLLGAIVFILATVGVWLIRPTASPDPAVRTYRKFCTKLARLDIHRRPNEGPVDFSRRVGRQRPEIAQSVEAVTIMYVELRYTSSSGNYKLFDKMVSSFRPI